MTTATNRRFRFSLRTLFIVFALAGMLGYWAFRTYEQTRYTEAFSDAMSRAIVENAERIEAFRLKSATSVDDLATSRTDLASYPTVGAVVNVPPEVGKRIAAKLLDEKSYFRNAAKACIPNYGVRIAFFTATIGWTFCFASNAISCSCFSTNSTQEPATSITPTPRYWPK